MISIAYTVGMYSPGKAFVVYDIKRQVCRDDESATTKRRDAERCSKRGVSWRELRGTYLANSAIACDDALGSSVSCLTHGASLADAGRAHTLSDWVPGAAMMPLDSRRAMAYVVNSGRSST